MDDVDRKMFAQLDDDMPAQRVNALEMLRERMNKATPPRKFRDIAAEWKTRCRCKTIRMKSNGTTKPSKS